MARLAVIAIGLIRLNPVALRSVNKDSEDFKGIRDSIKIHGVLNPINVREKAGPDNLKYELVDGLHRYTAAADAGLSEIPCQIMEGMDDSAALEAQIVGNVQKAETKPIEYTRGLQRLLVLKPTMTEAELARSLGRSPQWISARLSLTKLADSVKSPVNEGKIPLSNAFALAKLPPEEQPQFVDRAITMPNEQFALIVAERVKAIKDAARKGREAAPEGFVAVPHIRNKAELEAALGNTTVLGDVLSGITDPVQAAAAALRWALCLDEASIADSKAKYEKAQKDREEAKKLREAEREKQKAEKAEKAQKDALYKSVMNEKPATPPAATVTEAAKA